MLNGLFDIYNRLEYLTENGDILPNLKRLVPWEDFRGELEVIYDHERKSNAGRRPFDVVMMFKILILQSLYNLSDDEMEYQIMDRLSFMRFLGLDLDSRVPDAKTIWLFRSKLEEHKLTRKLFDKFNAFLAESGFVARKGQIVDATIVRVPTQRNTREENEAIKAGNPPVENWSDAKKCQKDTDARWTQKRGKNYFGYKNHIEVDVQHKIIRDYKITDAAVHDSKVFEDILDEKNTSRDVYADSAHRPLILNYFRAKKQFNSGIVEGLNRKINLTIRKSFGFRTLKIAKVCLYHQLGELPEPDFAHKFW